MVLRPVDLYKLNDLISGGRAYRDRAEYARRLAFGDEIPSLGENLRNGDPGESNDRSHIPHLNFLNQVFC